jgi:hypothetical protein
LGSWLVAHFAALVRYVLAMPSHDDASKSFLRSCTEALQNELRDRRHHHLAHAGPEC